MPQPQVHPQSPPPAHPIAIVIHGGAGNISRSTLSPEKEAACRAALREALDAGYRILQQGGASLDAVEAAIAVLEDSPWFNAGKGAVFTSAGTHELDASIMDGATLRAGAVAAVRRVRHPIRLARQVMERTPHVLLVGEGAEALAREAGLELVDPAWFDTPERRAAWEKRRSQAPAPNEPGPADVAAEGKHGTVGAVALDRHGHLAAGTSTGGLSGKRPGRVGDSPLIGAGTYARDATCAVSATGQGEFFIRLAVAHEISARVEHRGLSAAEAAAAVIREVGWLGGEGGVIVLDARGRVATPFNTTGMFRGWRVEGRAPVVRIGPED
ncbi:MAG: isoaspartyl peptidase/L-asparaginase [Verrucomicrobia bacterium]|nr:MAG: isoaspartyl peptidase/L-asparaginase [Verrucomicrobiota bacterium]